MTPTHEIEPRIDEDPITGHITDLEGANSMRCKDLDYCWRAEPETRNELIDGCGVGGAV
jgi:hypothetical protein